MAKNRQLFCIKVESEMFNRVLNTALRNTEKAFSVRYLNSFEVNDCSYCTYLSQDMLYCDLLYMKNSKFDLQHIVEKNIKCFFSDVLQHIPLSLFRMICFVLSNSNCMKDHLSPVLHCYGNLSKKLLWSLMIMSLQ